MHFTMFYGDDMHADMNKSKPLITWIKAADNQHIMIILQKCFIALLKQYILIALIISFLLSNIPYNLTCKLLDKQDRLKTSGNLHVYINDHILWMFINEKTPMQHAGGVRLGSTRGVAPLWKPCGIKPFT